MKTLAILGASIAAAAIADNADAITLQFTLTGTDYHLNPDNSITPKVYDDSWYLDTNPTPDYYIRGVETAFSDVTGSFNYGTDLHADVDDLSFYAVGTYARNAQALFDSDGIIDVIGQARKPFYTGSARFPVFQTGTFLVTDYFSNSPLTLTVAAVPEPASWLMMIGGFGLIGATMRARRTSLSYGKA